ncbi:hypothetical protein FRB95_007839 [Tulasnella sp. JGI-2019a]|nr:hypothetical protein FRB95_007839 [Tulasnella sp. JGI-2019a]
MKAAGSIRWSAPELMEDVPRSPKSDIYSFGMTIVEIITGKVPYPEFKNASALFEELNSGRRPPATPSSRNGKSFINLWEIASSCWEADPLKRPSARDVSAKVSCTY